jgi:phosphatidylglycerophosphatase A
MNGISFKQLKDPIVLIAVGFGSGLTPKAPGTAGTLIAIPLFLLMRPMPLISYLLITTSLFIAGIWICTYTAEKLGVHDHPSIVIDEVVGYLITMTAAPEGWLVILVGFILFRLLDAVKPWPISWLDRSISGGMGIMVDDVAAGIVALAILQGLLYFQFL